MAPQILRHIVSASVALVAACFTAPAGGEADALSTWLDLESRIQYAYYTENRHALENLSQMLSGKEAPMESYYMALANYRLALLSAEANKDAARSAAERCVQSLDRTLAADAESAEALALQSACLGMLAELKSWRAPLAGPKSLSQGQKALKVAPRNPRALLVDALNDYERAAKDKQARAAALAKFKAAVEAFEKERHQASQAPGWGAAEAYAYLGRAYLEQGDVIAARDALERALLLAPEFTFARKLIARIISG